MPRRPPSPPAPQAGAAVGPPLRLRAVPGTMRAFVLTVYAVAVAGLAVAAVVIGPADIAATFTRPEPWIVLALVAVADLYPLMPWMRDVRGRIRIHWSGAFTLALVLVGGPATVVLFPLIALLAASSLPSTVWRLGFNVSVVTLEGLAGVLLLDLLFGPWPADPGAGGLLAAGTVVALVWEAVNVGLVCSAMMLLDGTPLRECLLIAWRRTGPWLAALVTAPMVAVIVLTTPILVPGLALVTVVVHTWIANLIRKTDEARTDQLTGLANRTAALELLESGLVHHRRTQTMTLIMIDLDGFKAVNDTYGHDAGDRVLAEIGARIRDRVAEELMVARLGGDEFVVLGPDVSDPDRVIDAVHGAVRAPLEVPGGIVRLDCSSGWVHVEQGLAPLDVLRAADRNLYRAKASRHSPDPARRGADASGSAGSADRSG